jgi:hypothetical protein
MIYLSVITLALICFLVWNWCYRCDHKYFIVRNLHGDERCQTGKTRELRCDKCGKVKWE